MFRYSDKRYRPDVRFWETRVKFLFFTFYKYEVWERGKNIKKYRLIKLKRRTAQYFTFVGLPMIEVGRKEFQEVYKGNKWLIPVNRKLNLERE